MPRLEKLLQTLARVENPAAGQAMGRDRRHFFEEASRVDPELADRDETYRDRIMEMLDNGELS